MKSALDKLVAAGIALTIMYVPDDLATKERVKRWRISVMDRGFGGGEKSWGDTLELAAEAMCKSFVVFAQAELKKAEGVAHEARVRADAVTKEWETT